MRLDIVGIGGTPIIKYENRGVSENLTHGHRYIEVFHGPAQLHATLEREKNSGEQSMNKSFLECGI